MHAPREREQQLGNLRPLHNVCLLDVAAWPTCCSLLTLNELWHAHWRARGKHSNGRDVSEKFRHGAVWYACGAGAAGAHSLEPEVVVQVHAPVCMSGLGARDAW